MEYENTGEGAAAKQGGYEGDQQQQLQPPPQPQLLQELPNTNYEKKDDNVKVAHEGEGCEPKAAPPKEQQPRDSAPPAAHDEEPKGGVKEKIKEKLHFGGGHSTPSEDTHATSPPKKGVFEKVKDKISPHSS